MQDETVWVKGKVRIYVPDSRYDEEIGQIMSSNWTDRVGPAYGEPLKVIGSI